MDKKNIVHINIIKTCTDNGTHLVNTDMDGFCNHCGYQETLEEITEEEN